MAVLKAANLDAFFEAQVDGNMIQAEQLAGKPAPSVRPMATWRYSPIGMCRTCSQRAGSDCPRVPGSTSC